MKSPPIDLESPAAIQLRLKSLRLAMGMKQAPWCRLVGISTAAWNNFESGYRRISIDQAIKICSAVGVSLDWIYRGQAGALPFDLAIKIKTAESRLTQPKG